jgi:hypothetical protein
MSLLLSFKYKAALCGHLRHVYKMNSLRSIPSLSGKIERVFSVSGGTLGQNRAGIFKNRGAILKNRGYTFWKWRNA